MLFHDHKRKVGAFQLQRYSAPMPSRPATGGPRSPGTADGARPSMNDVARRAGVALGTVSNVLNNPHKVADRPRRRVEAAIADLGFVRNSAARTLAAGA